MIELDSSMETSSGPPTSSRRAKSVPASMLADRNMLGKMVSFTRFWV